MARIRSLKPSIWTDQRFIRLSRDERLLCIGMISHADDEGRLFASPTKLSGDVFPGDNLAPSKVAAWRDSIAASGLIDVYEIDGQEYAEFPRWTKHQRISHPQASALPRRNDSSPDCGTAPEPLRPSHAPDAGRASETGRDEVPPNPPETGGHKPTNPRALGTNPRGPKPLSDFDVWLHGKTGTES